MTLVSQNNVNSIPLVQAALDKLRSRHDAGADIGLSKAELDALIAHVASTIGDFQMPDVPM